MVNYYKEEIIEKFRKTLAAAVENVKTGKDLKVRISDKNSKMGNVASVSVVPFLSCPGICKSTCGRLCYAAKIANLRPSVLYSYAINQALAIYRPDIYWNSIDLACKAVRYFRFHVSGDIINYNYWLKVVETANNNTTTQILIFTKQYKIVNDYLNNGLAIPENLHVLFSGWENLKPENPHKLPETNVIPKNVPDDWWNFDESFKICGGNCFNCACRGVGCWQVKSGETVLFRLH